MKTLNLVFVACLALPAGAQIAINNTANPPHSSAMLDITSTNRGLLAPRMTMAERNSIASPATGLLIYQTDNVTGFYYNAGTPAAKNWLLIGQNLSYWNANGAHIYKNNGGNVGIGTVAPEAYLEISGSATPQLIIKGVEGGFRPGIQFKNNNIHYISGDDLSEETFGFYSKFSSQRTYGTRLHIYGSALDSWGTSLGLRHDGGKAVIETDVGNLILKQGPNANVGIGTDVPMRLITIDGSSMPSEIQFVNNTSGKTANDGATIGIVPSTPHASFWNYENADLYFGTNNTRYLTIKPDGKIGVGTNVPDAWLHVRANSSTTVPGLLLTETEADNVRLMFKSTAVSTKNWMISAGLNASDPSSRLDIIYYNGVNTPQNVLSVTGDGEVQVARTGDANMIPVAYGSVWGDGSKMAGTNNFTCTYDAANKRYFIAITGQVYDFHTHVAVINNTSSSTYSYFHGSMSDKLVAYFRDKDGNYISTTFSFIIYKP
jgi:hypothetical protein